MKGIELCADCAYYNMKSHKCTRGCKIDPDTKKGDDIHFFVDCLLPDVQPVKHGEWRKDEQGYDVYVECSECGLNLSISNYIENEWREILKYCPCCGARMDGDSE